MNDVAGTCNIYIRTWINENKECMEALNSIYKIKKHFNVYGEVHVDFKNKLVSEYENMKCANL